MTMQLGFIGAGNMATALASGVIGQGVLPGEDTHVFDVSAERMAALHNQLGVITHDSCEEMIACSDIVVLAIKPNVVGRVLSEQRQALKGKALISICAGWTVDQLRAELPGDARLLRVMPNTPALCGEGMAAFSLDHSLTEEETAFAGRMFGKLGRVQWVADYQMDAVVGVSGSGPAYVYMIIEALADAGVALGLTRAQSLEMAAQMVKGSAEMVLSTGRHPGELKDAVCSPGGTTIAAVRKLEAKGLRSAVMEAAITAAEKSADMSR